MYRAKKYVLLDVWIIYRVVVHSITLLSLAETLGSTPSLLTFSRLLYTLRWTNDAQPDSETVRNICHLRSTSIIATVLVLPEASDIDIYQCNEE